MGVSELTRLVSAMGPSHSFSVLQPENVKWANLLVVPCHVCVRWASTDADSQANTVLVQSSRDNHEPLRRLIRQSCSLSVECSPTTKAHVDISHGHSNYSSTLGMLVSNASSAAFLLHTWGTLARAKDMKCYAAVSPKVGFSYRNRHGLKAGGTPRVRSRVCQCI